MAVLYGLWHLLKKKQKKTSQTLTSHVITCERERERSMTEKGEKEGHKCERVRKRKEERSLTGRKKKNERSMRESNRTRHRSMREKGRERGRKL